MANFGFNSFLIISLCIWTVNSFAAYPRANWMQMERIEPAKETQPDSETSERVVRGLLKDMLRRMSQSLDSPQTAQSQKKKLTFSAGLSRDELENLINVPEEVHQKWEQFKQTYGTLLPLLKCVFIYLYCFIYIYYSEGVQVRSR